MHILKKGHYTFVIITSKGIFGLFLHKEFCSIFIDYSV